MSLLHALLLSLLLSVAHAKSTVTDDSAPFADGHIDPSELEDSIAAAGASASVTGDDDFDDFDLEDVSSFGRAAGVGHSTIAAGKQPDPKFLGVGVPPTGSGLHLGVPPTHPIFAQPAKRPGKQQLPPLPPHINTGFQVQIYT